jgi:hypothetical protein
MTITDLNVPAEPKNDLDSLIDYFQNVYPVKREQLLKSIDQCKQFKDKLDILTLGYQSMEFRMELDSWLGLAGQILDQNKGDQLNIAHDQRSEDKRKASNEVVKAQAANLVAPLKRAHQELKDTQDLLNKMILFAQTQLRAFASDEYGDILASNHDAPEKMFFAPNTANSLKRLTRSKDN